MADNRKPSAAYTRFTESLVIGFDQWHDGLGYDLGAMEQVTLEERASIEANLIGRLSDGGGWRDVEALVALGTPAALDAVRAATKNANPEVRLRFRAPGRSTAGGSGPEAGIGSRGGSGGRKRSA